MNIYSKKAAPYVYMVTHKITHEFYIGYRFHNVKLDRPSSLDFPLYRTSRKEIVKNFSEYEWVILAEFFDSESAYDFEQRLIREYWHDPLLMNKYCHCEGKKRWRTVGPLSEKHKKKMAEIMASRYINHPEINQKISQTITGTHWFNNGEISTQVRECPIGFVPGRLTGTFTSESARKAGIGNKGKSQEKVTCPHCGTAGGKSTLKQHHFDKCDVNIKHKLIHTETDEIIEVSKLEFKKQYGSPLYYLLNHHQLTLKGWKLFN
jgi:hypothetical protein